jgi:hypothetical protein
MVTAAVSSGQGATRIAGVTALEQGLTRVHGRSLRSGIHGARDVTQLTASYVSAGPVAVSVDKPCGAE